MNFCRNFFSSHFPRLSLFPVDEEIPPKSKPDKKKKTRELNLAEKASVEWINKEKDGQPRHKDKKSFEELDELLNLFLDLKSRMRGHSGHFSAFGMRRRDYNDQTGEYDPKAARRSTKPSLLKRIYKNKLKRPRKNLPGSPNLETKPDNGIENANHSFGAEEASDYFSSIDISHTNRPEANKKDAVFSRTQITSSLPEISKTTLEDEEIFWNDSEDITCGDDHGIFEFKTRGSEGAFEKQELKSAHRSLRMRRVAFDHPLVGLADGDLFSGYPEYPKTFPKECLRSFRKPGETKIVRHQLAENNDILTSPARSIYEMVRESLSQQSQNGSKKDQNCLLNENGIHGLAMENIIDEAINKATLEDNVEVSSESVIEWDDHDTSVQCGTVTCVDCSTTCWTVKQAYCEDEPKCDDTKGYFFIDISRCEDDLLTCPAPSLEIHDDKTGKTVSSHSTQISRDDNANVISTNMDATNAAILNNGVYETLKGGAMSEAIELDDVSTEFDEQESYLDEIYEQDFSSNDNLKRSPSVISVKSMFLDDIERSPGFDERDTFGQALVDLESICFTDVF